jgi:D-sedoheptulose 7-phosphate isomerase
MYLEENIKIAQNFPIESVVELTKIIIAEFKACGGIVTFGNGGGASIASHFASDISQHPFVSDDKHNPILGNRLSVYCLNDSPSLITRIANDIGYKDIFKEQLKNFVNPYSLVIAFSGSGNSPNILEALDYAKSCGSVTILVGGRDGGKAKHLADLSILIPGDSNFPGQVGGNNNCFHIEDFQTVVSHMVTGLLKEYVSERNRFD